jgi:Tol biopolymer transport system component
MIIGKLRPDKLASGTPKADPLWESIWQLVLRAEQVPPEERQSFIDGSGVNSFALNQALAILEGSDSLNTAQVSSCGESNLNSLGRFVPQIGARVGRFRLGALLGSGGSGTVYAGFDEHLNRPVAIKFLKPGRKSHDGAETLPLREARAASALNHPNIITVLEVIEDEELSAIVMEFVDGATLRVAGNGSLPLQQTLSYGLQLCEALAAAHECGLIHGDVKPDNAMVRKDGYVKLLDFGLTLNMAVDEVNSSSLSGTLRYLAPERWSGHPPSAAADVFALGVTLFELLTGRFPSEADTKFEFFRTMIDTQSARTSVSRIRVPSKLKSLLEDTLQANPASRPCAREVASRLAELRVLPETGHLRRPLLLVAGAIFILLLVLALTLARPHLDSGSATFSRMTVRPLASQPGIEDDPSVSPNGEWISCLYRPSTADPPQLQVHPLAGGPPTVIDTSGLIPDGRAAWSPDNAELAFAAQNAIGNRAIYRVSRKGGRAQKVTDCRRRNDFSCELDWSPDGKVLVVADRVGAFSEVYKFDLGNHRRRELVSGERKYLESPRYSPDGLWVAYTREVSWDNIELYVIAAHGGVARSISNRAWIHQGFSWSADGRSLVAISSRPGSRTGSSQQIWQFPIDGGSPSPLGDVDVARGNKPTLSRSKNVFAWVRDLSTSSLWEVSTQFPPETPQMLVHSAAVDIDADWSSDRRIVFRSDRSGVSQLWIASAGGMGAWQATRFRGTFVGDPHWSPDGNSIAFMGRSEGNSDVFVMRCGRAVNSCEQPGQLTHDPAVDSNPTWSRDGRRIYFSSSRTGTYEVWRMPARGGQPERMTWGGGYMSRESADGEWLYYSKLWPTSFWRIPLAKRATQAPATEVIPEVPSKAGATWALGERDLFYYPSTEEPTVRFPSIRAFELNSGKVRNIDVGPVRLNRGLSLSADQHWLLHSQADRVLKLIMVAQ